MTSSIQKTTFIVFLFLLISPYLYAQENNFDPQKKYHPDSLKYWTTSLFDEISKAHPGFYSFTKKDRFDFLIDSTNQTIQKELTELEFYRKLKPLIAQIGCLHTSISLSKEHQDYLDLTETMIPIEIFIDSNRKVFISKNYASNLKLPIGSELLSINGKPINTIIKKLLNNIPSDGYNQTEKILLLDHRFAFWYQSIIEANETFIIEVSDKEKIQEFTLNGVSKEKLPSLESIKGINKKALEFKFIDNVAILKINSFAKTDIKNSNQNFKKFIQEAFQEIQSNGIQELIIDLRYNTGGTDANAAFLASYFFDQPFRYWDKIEVTEAIAKDVEGFERLFYKRPEKNEELYQWKKTWVTKEFDFYELQQPSKVNYNGSTYIISNGLCLSSCADFTAILSYNNKAVVVGQESGGGYQGNTSGMMPDFVISPGLRVTIPLHKYTNAVDLTKNFGRGTIPDHIIEPSFKEWINSNDVEMDFTLNLLQKKL
ncbi:S41 family peptidase [Marivirga tractuosa]|uniref:S41 family peptidase n=1 Tax=Marivirga tractuosa TaxID=1006 RepID=UPI0035CEB57C